MKSLYLTQWKSFIRYHDLGEDGPTLVYLPGLSVPSLVNFLAVATDTDMISHRALLVDYLGSGFSDHPIDFDHSIENHAQNLAALLDHEGIKHCTIMGHSMGGTVGIMLALLRPDLVTRLVVAEGNISPGGGLLSQHVASHSENEWVNEGHATFLQAMRNDAIEGDSIAALLSGAWRLADPIGFYRSSLALVNLAPTFKEQFLRLSLPRTFVYGENSLPENTDSIQGDAPDPTELEQHGIQVVVVPAAGHAMMFENLSGFVDALKLSL